MLAALLAATSVLYLWNLSACGYGNAFYAAAAQAGAQSWSAWFFGSLDAQNFITVDKPPGALWVTGLSVRLFGLSSWSVLVPQALMGVAAVAVLYATMRRTVSDAQQGQVAGLLAGAILACTPAAALMFRFNNPDALLVLLLTIAAYCVTRAVQSGSWRWLAVVGAVMGTAFLTKMLQAAVVLPGFAAAYLLAAPIAWRKRLLHLTVGALTLIAAAGWWVLIVQSIPASSRPYIGGSTDNSVLDLAFGYNGMNRILGTPSEGASDWGGPAARMPNAAVGVHRLFTGEFGSEISWLLPVAVFVVAFGAYLALRRKLVRDEVAALLTWGGWLLITGLVFSFMNGTVHPYYTVALAPAIGALVGLGGAWAWRVLPDWDGRMALVLMLVLGGGWSSIMLTRNHFGPALLPWAVAGSALVAAALTVQGRRSWARIGIVVGIVAACAGTAGYSIATAMTPHHGTVPNAVGSVHRTSEQTAKLEEVVTALAGAGWTGDEATNRDLAVLLASANTPWSAATNGSQSAAVLELASGTSVMAIGGWSGDPVPTLAQFIDDVHARKIAYYVEAGAGARYGRVIHAESHTESHTREIADWVAANYRPQTVGDSLVYRLS